MIPLPLIGAGIGLLGGVGKMFSRGKANKQLDKLMGQNPQYQANPLAAQRLAYAAAFRDARMPGAAAAERNIMGGMGNTIAAAQRNASDSSQALAMAAAAQGQAQQGFNQLGMQEGAFKMNQIQNYNQGVEGQIAEDRAVFEDEKRRFSDLAAIEGAKMENRANTWGDIASMGFGLADFAQSGGFDATKGWFKKKPFRMTSPQQANFFGTGLRMADEMLPPPR